MTTRHGLEGSATDVVAMLARLFPDARTESSVVELMRSGDYSPTPHSKTPQTDSRRLAIDVSVSLARRESAQLIAQQPATQPTKSDLIDPALDLRPGPMAALAWVGFVVAIIVAIAVIPLLVRC